MAIGSLLMSKVNYKDMDSKALRKYVLEHREDEEAIEELMSRIRGKGTVYPMPTEENMEWMTEMFKQKAKQGRRKG
jgi:(2Fe-2S) ferredoxin